MKLFKKKKKEQPAPEKTQEQMRAEFDKVVTYRWDGRSGR
jgi:hypothetical protein